MLIQTDDRKHMRDTDNHALLVTDQAALQRARNQRTKAKEQTDLHREVGTLRTHVKTLSSLVEQLLSKSNM
jgi:hypothetical protein